MHFDKNENKSFSLNIECNDLVGGKILLACEKVYDFKLRPFQFISTPLGPAIAVGVCQDSHLWLWLEKDDGVSFWDNFSNDYFDQGLFSRNQAPFAYPPELMQSLRKSSVPMFNGVVDVEETVKQFRVKISPRDAYNKILIEFDDSSINKEEIDEALQTYFLEDPEFIKNRIILITHLIQEYLVSGTQTEIEIKNCISETLAALEENEKSLEEQNRILYKQYSESDRLLDETLRITLQTSLASMIESLNDQIAQNKNTIKYNKDLSTKLNQKVDNFYKKEAVMGYLINLFKDMELDCNSVSPKILKSYKAILEAFGNFIYETAELSKDSDPNNNNIDDTENDHFRNALLCYFLADTDDTHVLKNNCFMQLLKIKRDVLPNQFNLVKYSEKHPKRIFELLDSMKSITKFPSDNVFFLFELFKLYTLASVLFTKLNKDSTENKFDDKIKNLLPVLMVNNHTREMVVRYCEQYFPDNFHLLVITLTEGYYNFEPNILEQKILHTASVYKKDRNSDVTHHDKDLFSYGLLLLKSTKETLNTDGQALFIELISNKNKDALEFLRMQTQKNNFYFKLQVAKIYFELAKRCDDDDKINDYTTSALYLCQSIIVDGRTHSKSALYLCYQINRDFRNHLLISDLTACLEIPEAFDELKRLADGNNSEACFELGNVYLSNIDHPDYNLAAYYFEKSDKPIAKFKLGEMIVNGKIKSDINPVTILVAFEDDNRLSNQAEALLIKYAEDKKKLYYPEACLALAKTFHYKNINKKEAAKYYSLYFNTASPNITIFWAPLNDSDIRYHFSIPELISIFKAFHFDPDPIDFFSSEELRPIVIDIFKYGHDSACELLLSHSEFRQHLDEPQLVSLLSPFQKMDDEKKLAAIVKALLNERHAQALPALFKWLENRPIILCSIVRENALVRHNNWQTFLKTRKVLEILRENGLRPGFDKNNAPFRVHLFFGEPKKEIPVLTPKEQYIKTKMEAFQLIYDRINQLKVKFAPELRANPNCCEELNNLRNLLTELNSVDEDELPKFMGRLNAFFKPKQDAPESDQNRLICN